MFRQDTPEEAAFRMEVRSWLEENLPPEERDRSAALPLEEGRIWHKKLTSKGWACPSWPKEYGGMGATLNQQMILSEELGRVGAPSLNAPGLNFLAPALMAFGTDEQKSTYLPKMLAGDLVWAQGYSEPNSGSDLASLRTRAEVKDDHFIVNGQKIWGRPHEADWMFALVRTDPDATPKHAGISLILIDLDTPGITVHGIDAITGDEEFGTIFFDDVKVPRENLVGPLNGGWKVANHVLNFERLSTSSPQNVVNALDRLKRVAEHTGAMESRAFRDRLAGLSIDVMALQAISAHAVELTNGGAILGPDSSIMKVLGTETQQAIMDLALEATGAFAPGWDKIETEGKPTQIAELWLQVRRVSIYGGANEIQRNVVAKRVLGLPS